MTTAVTRQTASLNTHVINLNAHQNMCTEEEKVVVNLTTALKVLMHVTGKSRDCRMHRSDWFGQRTRAEITPVSGSVIYCFYWRKANTTEASAKTSHFLF